MSLLGRLFDLVQVQASLLVVIGQQGVDRLGVVGVDSPELDEVVLLDDGVGELEQSSGVGVQVVSLGFRQDTLVEFSDLDVFLGCTFVRPVALSGDYVAGDLEGSLLQRSTTKRRRRLGRRCGLVVRVGEVRRLASVVGVDPHGAVKVVRRVEVGHERTVDGDLVDVGGLQSVVLGVSVEECSPLEQGVGRELDTGDEGTGGEGGLFDVSVVVFRVSVELHVTDFLHGELRSGPDG